MLLLLGRLPLPLLLLGRPRLLLLGRPPPLLLLGRPLLLMRPCCRVFEYCGSGGGGGGAAVAAAEAAAAAASPMLALLQVGVSPINTQAYFKMAHAVVLRRAQCRQGKSPRLAPLRPTLSIVAQVCQC